MPHVKTLFLDRATVDSLLSYPLIWEAVESVFRSDAAGHVFLPHKEFISIGADSQLFPMSAALYDAGIAGVKWTNFYPQNPFGFPTCWSHVLILTHLDDGQPYAILDATGITAKRTAGGHAVVAAAALTRPDPQVIGVAGLGAQGMAAVRAFDERFHPEEIRILTGERSRKLHEEELRSVVRAKLRFVSSGRELAAESDIVVTATTASEPVLRETEVPAGCTVCGMYSFVDLDPALSRCADKWILGQRSSDKEEILEDPLLVGRLSEKDVYASLGEILTGKRPGRETPDERIVFTHMGMAALDIAVADRVVAQAQRLGLGQMLTLN